MIWIVGLLIGYHIEKATWGTSLTALVHGSLTLPICCMRAVTLLRGCNSSSTFEPQLVSRMPNYRSKHTRVVQFFDEPIDDNSLRQGA
jgi:hypothetical protein